MTEEKFFLLKESERRLTADIMEVINTYVELNNLWRKLKQVIAGLNYRHRPQALEMLMMVTKSLCLV